MLYSISKFSLKIDAIQKHIVSFRNTITYIKEFKNADSRTRKLTEDRLVILHPSMRTIWEHELNKDSLPGQVESPVQPVSSWNLQMWFHWLHQSWFVKARKKFSFYHIKFCICGLVFSVKCVELLFFYMLCCWIFYTISLIYDHIL